MRPERVTARRNKGPIQLIAEMPDVFCSPVTVPTTLRKRMRGIKGAPPGQAVLLAASAVHSLRLRRPVTAVALSSEGAVLATRRLGPNSSWHHATATWILELPEKVSIPSDGGAVRLLARVETSPVDPTSPGRRDIAATYNRDMPGTLILCGTPIGNMADASPRLDAALRSADIIYAEDTRRSSYLLQTLGLSRPLRSYFTGNEAARAEELAGRLATGEVVALLTDAGMPTISDPGLTAARAAYMVDAKVTVIPGPSAVTAALAISGLPSDRFVFDGFLPRKKRGRDARLAELESEPRTIVLFAAASRLVADLEDLVQALGPSRPIAISRELTKLHEEVWRGSLAMAVAEFAGRPSIKGEVTIVIGPRPVAAADLSAAAAAARAAIETGIAPSEAVREAAAAHHVSRRLLYQEVIAPGPR